MAATSVPLTDGRTARFLFTDRRHGDLQIAQAAEVVDQRRQHLAPHPWTWLRQVHGAEVVEVTAPGQHQGAEADAAVVSISNAVVAIQVADCAPVVLIAPGGAVGVVHAGWRGLKAGILERSVAKLRARAGPEVQAVLGPCIHPECYEFSEADLEPLTQRFGPKVRARTATGSPALDVPAAVEKALDAVGVHLDRSFARCTACDDRLYSHRARSQTGRQAAVAWLTE